MKSASFRHPPFPAKRGAALLIVLFFVVLLCGLLIAFLSRAMTARIVANSSAGDAKAGILAQGAGDIIIGDLKQEIIDGSTASNVATGYTVYTPKGASATSGGQSTMTPAIVGFTPAYTSGLETDGLANLLKVSKYSLPFYSSATNANYAATGANRASNVNSYSNPSLNGRVITPARWNSHYLIARATTGTSLTSTPVTNFVNPDWIIVTRSGANTAYASYNSILSNPNATNASYAVGRYAYAIYNEGGLLDMNAAGYPGTDATSGSVGLTTNQISTKGSLALSDLTQLPVSAGNSTAVMTQAQINNLVGWRNYYTAQLTAANGSFGSIVFSAQSSQTNWVNNFVTYNGTNAFLGANTNALSNPAPPTDQALLSRQQLISLTESLGISPDALQYMGTFSRALEQPNVTPDPNRPTVVGTMAPPAATVVDTYQGNNDAWGGDNSINPSFLNIRVGTSFTRLDGTTAVVGEPLVKRKFALSRLGLVTYSSTAPQTMGNAIYDRFGLYRASASNPWTYNHGQNSIMTLSQVAALTGSNAREPDFAELLKAAILAGSLAKAGPGLHDTGGNYQYTVDSTTDYQVLQIMANLIDQYDTDSYPTVIQIANGTGYRTVYGVEDLPYFYRYHLFSVVDKLPAPAFSKTTTTTFPAVSGFTTTGSTTTAMNFPAGTTTSASWTVANAASYGFAGATKWAGGITAGEATYFYVPDLWNPHDPNTTLSSSTNRPTQFRIYASTDDPVGATPAWEIGSETVMANQNSSGSSILPETTSGGSVYVYPISAPATMTAATSYLTFSDSNGTLFREPTLLWNTNPTGIALSGSGSATDANTHYTYYGIVAGKSPVYMQATFVSNPPQPTDGKYVFQGTAINTTASLPAGAYQQITFTLQYQDPTNAANWITYDVKYPDLHGLQDPNLVVNINDYSNASYQNVLRTGQFSANTSSFDPRTARWGIGTASSLGQNATSNDYLLEVNADTADFTVNSVTGNTTFGKSLFTVLETQRPRPDRGNQVNYSNPGMTSDPGQSLQMRLFSGVGFSASNGQNQSPLEFDGLMSQNNPALVLLDRDNATPGQFYFEDPDGVARRAMGAYSAVTTSALVNPATGTSASSLAGTSPNLAGLPLATASTYIGTTGVGTATAQSQSRPIVLNRAFRSVSDMSYAFRGTPWRNIDFFTPESGDSALLDTFCVNEPPSNAIVAGKVDLNTRQEPVLQAIIAGASRDEWSNATSPPAYALSPLSGTEAKNIASKLTSITTDTTDNWRGPLPNLASLVGRFIPNAASGATTANDTYTYTQPAFSWTQTANTYTYAGLSAALDSTVYSTTLPGGALSTAPYTIERFKGSGLRPLIDAGQTRVWSLLIDVVAQTGRYPQNATGLDQFVVDGEKRLWIHVAIDRYTGSVIDKQVEVVTQ